LGGSTLAAGWCDVDAHVADPVNNAAVETAPLRMNDLLFIYDGLMIIHKVYGYRGFD
jgi:hypothetical protein